MSRVLAIARADLERARRHKLVWGAVLLLGVMYLPWAVNSGLNTRNELPLFLLMNAYDLLAFSLVVVGAVAYNAVVGERSGGTVRFALGLGATRREVVLGKLLSRAAISCLAVSLVLLVVCVATVVGYGATALVPYAMMSGWMLCYVVVWTMVIVGFSAMFDSQYRTLGASVGVFALFSISLAFWNALVRPLFAFLFTGSFSVPVSEVLETAPLWVRVTQRLNPQQSLFLLVQWSVNALTGEPVTTSALLNLFGLLVVVAFGVVPLVVGLRRFERTDLGGSPPKPGFGSRVPALIPSLSLGRSATTSFGLLQPGSGQSRVRTLVGADLRQQRSNWVLVGAMAVVTLLVLPELLLNLGPSDGRNPIREMTSLFYDFFLPTMLLAVGIGHQAIVGERESGTIRLALGLPGTRRDLFVATLVARLASTTAVLGGLLLVAFAMVNLRFPTVPLVAFAATAALVLLVGAMWTCVAVGIAAAVSSRYRSLATFLGVYLLFSAENGLWGPVVTPLFELALGSPARPSTALSLAESVSPLSSLSIILRYTEFALGAYTRYSGIALPEFLFSAVVVVCFAVVPLVVGLRRFERADLG